MKSLFTQKAAPVLQALPAEITVALSALNSALHQRADLLQRIAVLANEESAAIAADAASSDYDQAETALALATDENFERLTAVRDAKAIAAAEARTALDTLRRRQRVMATALVEIESAIEAADAEWKKVAFPFRADLRARYRNHLVETMAAFVDALRLGYAIENGLPRSGLRSALDAVVIPDVVDQPDRPIPYLLKGHRSWLGDDVELGGADLGLLDHNHPEIQALRDLLKPLGDAERAAAGIVREIQTKRAREAEQARLSAPPRPRPKAPPDPTATMTDAEYRAHRAEQVNAHRLYPPPGPNPTYSDYRDGRKWA